MQPIDFFPPALARRFSRVATTAVMTVVLSACAVGPDYVVPAQDVGMAFAEHAMPGWSVAQPADHLPRDGWWQAYDDAILNGLLTQLSTGNQTVAEAEANYRAATATLRQARAAYLPTVTATADRKRAGSTTLSGDTNQLRADLSWELDIWGGVRCGVEAGDVAVLSSAALVANARLSQQSSLAQSYFQLRISDEQQHLLRQILQTYERSLTLTRNRYEAGLVQRQEVTLAETMLENARALLLAAQQRRILFEHAIAQLLGLPPSRFSLASVAFVQEVPQIPVGLPSELLQRRPDVASAERLAAQANANIGVKQAAWFPSLRLNANGGWSSASLGDLISVPARTWSLGAALAQTIFDGGLRTAAIEQSRAQYDAQAARYRQTVLTALREVEDQMTTLRIQTENQEVRLRALTSARESLQLIRNRYTEGLISYLDVVQIENQALSAEQEALNVVEARLLASVQLIAALGGGWDVNQLHASAVTPAQAEQINPPAPL
jgi:NodT family efflux transporter outer membrane factor (OMF) lipoprotein